MKLLDLRGLKSNKFQKISMAPYSKYIKNILESVSEFTHFHDLELF